MTGLARIVVALCCVAVIHDGVEPASSIPVMIAVAALAFVCASGRPS